MKTGIELITEERARQINVEGWTPEHDDTHDCGEMAQAAACYALSTLGTSVAEGGAAQVKEELWPWSDEWWKPGDHGVRTLVKAGALIAAEIDRLNRECPPDA